MATLLSSSLLFLSPLSDPPFSNHHLSFLSPSFCSQPWRCSNSKVSVSSSDVCVPKQPLIIDKSALIVREAVSEEELWAAACLRIRTFNEFKQESVGIEDHKKCLVEREFEALQERVAGKREGFRRVSCINASIPLSHLSSSSADLCTACKFTSDGGHRVVVVSLDLSQCLRLPDEIIGMKPQGIEADLARVCLSNVCVAKELHRNGLAYALLSKAKSVAEEWGTFCILSDLLSFGVILLLTIWHCSKRLNLHSASSSVPSSLPQPSSLTYLLIYNLCQFFASWNLGPSSLWKLRP